MADRELGENSGLLAVTTEVVQKMREFGYKGNDISLELQKFIDSVEKIGVSLPIVFLYDNEGYYGKPVLNVKMIINNDNPDLVQVSKIHRAHKELWQSIRDRLYCFIDWPELDRYSDIDELIRVTAERERSRALTILGKS